MAGELKDVPPTNIYNFDKINPTDHPGKRKGETQIFKNHIPLVVIKTWGMILYAEANLTAGFKKCGIFPLNA